MEKPQKHNTDRERAIIHATQKVLYALLPTHHHQRDQCMEIPWCLFSWVNWINTNVDWNITDWGVCFIAMSWLEKWLLKISTNVDWNSSDWGVCFIAMSCLEKWLLKISNFLTIKRFHKRNPIVIRQTDQHRLYLWERGSKLGSRR